MKYSTLFLNKFLVVGILFMSCLFMGAQNTDIASEKDTFIFFRIIKTNTDKPISPSIHNPIRFHGVIKEIQSLEEIELTSDAELWKIEYALAEAGAVFFPVEGGLNDLFLSGCCQKNRGTFYFENKHFQIDTSLHFHSKNPINFFEDISEQNKMISFRLEGDSSAYEIGLDFFCGTMEYCVCPNLYALTFVPGTSSIYWPKSPPLLQIISPRDSALIKTLFKPYVQFPSRM